MALIVTKRMHRSERTLAVACATLAACVLAGCAAPRREPSPSAGPRERAAAPAEPRRMVGLYRHRADDTSFLDCASGDQFPVAPDGAAPALQAAYAASRAVPGEPQRATVEARIVMRAPEAGSAPRAALQIVRVIGLTTQAHCAPVGGASATPR
jgi:hypothetical protein